MSFLNIQLLSKTNYYVAETYNYVIIYDQILNIETCYFIVSCLSRTIFLTTVCQKYKNVATRHSNITIKSAILKWSQSGLLFTVAMSERSPLVTTYEKYANGAILLVHFSPSNDELPLIFYHTSIPDIKGKGQINYFGETWRFLFIFGTFIS